MSAPSAALPAGSASTRSPRPRLLTAGGWRALGSGTYAMAQSELRKLRHDHLDILTRSVQPLLWLFIFGTALSHTHSLSLGSLEYRAYLAPGVMAQAAMFIAIFFGLAVIWERDEPLRQIVNNSGYEGAVVVERVRQSSELNFGFNAETEKYEDLVAAGVIDPTKVTRTALQNAASIAALLLTTEALISDIKEDQKAPAMPQGGGMGDMY